MRVDVPLLALFPPFSLEGSPVPIDRAIQKGGAWAVGDCTPFLRYRGKLTTHFLWRVPGSSLKDNSVWFIIEKQLAPEVAVAGACSLVTAKWKFCCHFIFRLTNSGCQWLFLASSWPEFRANCAKKRAMQAFIIKLTCIALSEQLH